MGFARGAGCISFPAHWDILWVRPSSVAFLGQAHRVLGHLVQFGFELRRIQGGVPVEEADEGSRRCSVAMPSLDSWPASCPSPPVAAAPTSQTAALGLHWLILRGLWAVPQRPCRRWRTSRHMTYQISSRSKGPTRGQAEHSTFSPRSRCQKEPVFRKIGKRATSTLVGDDRSGMSALVLSPAGPPALRLA